MVNEVFINEVVVKFKQIFLSFLAICLLHSCANNDESIEIPISILSKNKMAEALVSMHIYEAAINLNTLNNTSIAGMTSLRNWDFLKALNINYKQFNESFNFYALHPKLLNEVYQLALEELSKKQAQMLKPSK